MKSFQQFVATDRALYQGATRSTMNRQRRTAAWLALTLGAFGVQKFYVSQNLYGVLCFAFAGTGIPLLLGLGDAICWFWMDDGEFARRYGASGPPLLASGPVGRKMQTTLLLTWKIICLISWSIVPVALDLAGVAEGPIYFVGFVPLAAILWVTPVLAGLTNNAALRYLCDPIGSEARTRPRRTGQRTSYRERRCRVDHGDDQIPQDDLFPPGDWPELPGVNPATGLPMSGPGTQGVDSEGNPWGSDFSEPYNEH